MGMSKDLADSLISDMVSKKDDMARRKMLEAVSEMHLITFVAWLGLELNDHDGHPEECPFQNVEKVVDSYIEAIGKDIRTSMMATCAANGVEYVPDPNKEVRDAILAESDC